MRAAMKFLSASALACLLATQVLAQGVPPIGAPPSGWYRQPGVRDALAISNDQWTRLNAAYDRLDTRYRDEVGRLARLNEAERAARLRELNATYRADVGTAYSGVFDNKQMARYRQLELQQMGWSAFNDPALQKRFSFSDEQMRSMRDYTQQSDRTYREILDRAATNRDEALKMYDAWRKESGDRLNTLFNEQQRRTWLEMTGDPYTFPPNFDR